MRGARPPATRAAKLERVCKPREMQGADADRTGKTAIYIHALVTATSQAPVASLFQSGDKFCIAASDQTSFS